MILRLFVLLVVVLLARLAGASLVIECRWDGGRWGSFRAAVDLLLVAAIASGVLIGLEIARS